MAILSDQNRAEVRKHFDGMAGDVTVSLFTADDCEFCDDAVELNRELAELTDRISLEVHDLDSEPARAVGADRHGGGPVTGLTDGDIEGVLYFGLPSGQEFGTYVRDIVTVASGETGLDDGIRNGLADIDEAVNIKVFVTPTCPHCPRAVETAHRFAIENPHVTAEMIQSQEFMALAQEFGVRGVPQVTINDGAGQFVGAQPEGPFLDQVKQALA